MCEGIVVDLGAADRNCLEAVIADRNSRQKHVWRARIVLATADGFGAAEEIMRRAGVSKPSVWRWQERFLCLDPPARAVALSVDEKPQIQALDRTQTRRRLRRGVSHSIVALQEAINRFIAATNPEPRSFVWTASPDDVVAKARRGRQALEVACS